MEYPMWQKKTQDNTCGECCCDNPSTQSISLSTWSILKVMIFFISFLLLLNSVSFSQVKSSDLLDFILILDESASMRYNDPERIRVDASRMFIDLLHPNDRISIIGFGEKARIITPLVMTGSGRSLIESGLATVGDQNNNLPQSHGRYSMIGDALKAADSLLKQRTNPRKSIILIFTDGEFQEDDIRPDVSLTNHLELTYNTARQLGDHGSLVVACAFTKAANLEILSRVAREGGGFTEEVNNPSEIKDVFIRILKSLPGIGYDKIEPGVATKTFDLEENVWKLSLLAIKAKPGGPIVDITLIGPEGTKVEGELIDSRLYTVLNVTNPKPGQYTVKVPVENRLEVQILRRGSFNLNIVSPRAGERLVVAGQVLPILLSARGNGQIHIEGEAVTPLGDVKTLSVVPDNTSLSDTLWKAEISPQEAGAYHVTFAAIGTDGKPLGASTILQFTAVEGIEGSVTIDAGYANVGSPIRASANILPGLPVISQMMIVSGPETVDTVQMSETSPGESSREYSATYTPPITPGIYYADIVLIFNTNGEDLVQHKSQVAPKIFRSDSTASCKLRDEEIFDASINVVTFGVSADFSISPCTSNEVVINSERDSWNLPKDKEVSIAFSVSGERTLIQNVIAECSGVVTIDKLGSFPVKINMVLVPSIPFNFPIWLWPIIVIVGIIIVLSIYCRLRPKFDKNIVFIVESTGQEVLPSEYQGFCRGAVYANKHVYLDATLAPKSLRLKSSGPAVVEMTILDSIEGISIDGEVVEQGRTYRLFLPCEVSLPSGPVRLKTLESDISDFEITERGTENE